ncbi:MAG: hypothetical protein AB7O26_04920 [Planctomycetaceae bacterium]
MTRRTQLFLIFLFTLLGVAVLISQGSLPGAESTALEKLQQQVEKLEARVTVLEQLPGSTSCLQYHRPHLPHAVPPRQPQNWRREEFNGEPYYIVPLDGSPNR